MVIEDLLVSEKPVETTDNELVFAEADPFDRFAARALDFGVVLIPITGLLLSPMTKQISEFKLMGEWTNLIFHSVWMFSFGALIFCLYHGISESLWGQSFGKKILGIKVVDIWTGKNPSLWHSFFRSAFVLLQFFVFFIPFLILFVSPKGRGLHDKLADTWVISLNQRTKAKYRIWPIHLILRGGVAIVLALAFPLALKFFQAQVEALDLETLFSRSQDGQNDCRDILSLEEGMSLVATGAEDVRCLKDLADAEFVEGSNPSALAYLVKSFVYVDQAELSDGYLDQVCKTEPGSPACYLSQVISAWSDGDLNGIEEILNEAKDFSEPYLDLWALRYFQQSGHFEKSIRLTQKLESQPYIRDYVISEKAKAYYLVGEVETSDSLISTAQSEAPLSTYTQELVSWGCQRKLDQGCGQASTEVCGSLKRLSIRENLDSPQLLLGRMRLEECGQKEISTKTYLSEEQPRYWREFLYGLRKHQQGDYKSAWLVWKNVIKGNDTPDYLKAEAIRRMVMRPEISEIESLTVLIGHIESFEYRNSSSLQVASTFRKLDMLELAERLEGGKTPSDKRSPASVSGDRK